MSAIDAVNESGWSRHDVVRHMDPLPLVDELSIDDFQVGPMHRLHWISAAIALTLFLLARFDLLPATPW